MKISAKGRYGLAATIMMAQTYSNGESVTVTKISDSLGISKIYLEQVFSLLKRAGIVNSTKGAQGGYHLARAPKQITVFDVLTAIELSLFEKTEETVLQKAPEIEAAMHFAAFDKLSSAVTVTLKGVSLYDLVNETEKQKSDNNFMFYI